MTDETTTEQLAEIEGQGDTVQVREGRWRTRGGDIHYVTPTPEGDGREGRFPWWDSAYRQTWTSDGRYHFGEASPLDLVEYLGPIEPDKTQELPEYTPPDGWRVVRFGEQLLPGDVWVSQDGTEQRSNILQWDASAVSGGRCIRRIVPQPEPVSEPQAESDAELRIRLLQQANDSQAETIGRLLSEARDLNMEIGGLERQLVQRDARIRDLETIYSAATKAFEDANKANDALRVQMQILQQEASKKASRIEFLETLNAGNGAAIGDYRAQVEKLQSLVDTARQQLEAAATEHDSLSTQLAAVKAELASVAADRQRLQIELDAAQQVPADSPELRQLRADLAEVTRERDQYRDAFDRVIAELKTRSETAKAEAVEAIVEWLVPIRRANTTLRAAILFHLPTIMRSIAGLDSHAID